MFKRLFFTFMMLCLAGLEARIIETRHIEDVISLVDEETWFLVDLDNCMFEAKHALGHANWFYDEIDKKLQNGMERDEAIRQFYPEWVKTQKICSVKALEDGFVPSLTSFQEHGVVVMGLTHRQSLIAESTLRQIASLEFDFIKTAPSKDTFNIPSMNPILYQQGVLFVDDYNKKSDALFAFLTIIKQIPKKVVFIDDKRKNVEDLEEVLSKLGIEYTGVYYTAIEHVQSVYSSKIAQFQYKFLDKIMSNEAALLLMDHGLE